MSKKIRKAREIAPAAFEGVSQSSDTCLRCVASFREDSTMHVVPILILGGDKVLRSGARDGSGRCRAIQEG